MKFIKTFESFPGLDDKIQIQEREKIRKKIEKLIEDKFCFPGFIGFPDSIDTTEGIITNLFSTKYNNMWALVHDDNFTEEWEIDLIDFSVDDLNKIYLELDKMKIENFFSETIYVLNPEDLIKIWKKYKNKIDLDDFGFNGEINQNIFDLTKEYELESFFDDKEVQEWVFEAHPEKTQWLLKLGAKINDKLKIKYDYLIQGSRFGF